MLTSMSPLRRGVVSPDFMIMDSTVMPLGKVDKMLTGEKFTGLTWKL